MPIRDADLEFLLTLPPRSAIEYLQSLSIDVADNWFETAVAARQLAFTAAGVARLDLAAELQITLIEALEEGLTRAQTQALVLERAASIGMTAAQIAAVGAISDPWRWETIFRTNVQNSYNAGRFKFFAENAENRPYLQYRAVLDNRVRPEHAALNGLTAPVGDAIWLTHSPVLGFNCRCRLVALTAKQVESRNIQVRNTTPDDFITETRERDGIEQTRTGFVSDDGSVEFTGWGFDNNPALTRWAPNLEKYAPELVAAYRARESLFNR